jgi:hypothetical protein
MTKHIKSFSLIFAATIGVSAQHSHDSPHGGTILESGNYHIEMVKSGDALNFYLLDGNLKAVKAKVTGKVEFEFSNKTKATSNLAEGENGALTVALPKANIVEYCTVSLTVNGKLVSARFKNTVSEADRHHGHQH